MALADANTTAAALSGISLVVAIIAVLISLISLYRSHLAPFKVITAAGDLNLRIYRIKNGKDSWYIASADIPLQAVNSGARIGRILACRLRVSYPSISIPDAYETFKATFVVESAAFNRAENDRSRWLDDAVLADWKPFSILPKASVDQHVVFETRWDNPVVADVARFTLQQRLDGSRGWADVDSWELDLDYSMFAYMVRGSSYGTASVSVFPDGSVQEINPVDLHRHLKPTDPLPGPDRTDKGSRQV